MPIVVLAALVARLCFVATASAESPPEKPGSRSEGERPEEPNPAFVVRADGSDDEVSAALDGALVLAPEKVFVGPRLRISGGHITGGIDALFLYKSSDRADDGYDGVFLGHLFSFALGAQVEAVDHLYLSAGSGFDAWYLWGIDLNEAKFALPLWVEARYWATRSVGVFLNARYNAIASDGLDFGPTREQVSRGEDGGVPLMLTVGAGVRQ